MDDRVSLEGVERTSEPVGTNWGNHTEEGSDEDGSERVCVQYPINRVRSAR